MGTLTLKCWMVYKADRTSTVKETGRKLGRCGVRHLREEGWEEEPGIFVAGGRQLCRNTPFIEGFRNRI